VGGKFSGFAPQTYAAVPTARSAAFHLPRRN